MPSHVGKNRLCCLAYLSTWHLLVLLLLLSYLQILSVQHLPNQYIHA